jgi:type I restriction enzyme S subunit
MDLKSGYKQTDAGVIPEDWEVRFLPEVCSFEAGRAHEQYFSDFGRYVCVNPKFISSDGRVRKYSNVNFCRAKRNDIIMVMSDLPNGRALAKTFLADENDLYAVNQSVCLLRPYRDCPQYLFYVLNRNPYFLKFDDGVNQTHLLKPVFQRCPVALPPTRTEQESIASILSDTDTLIRSLEQLLAKKRKLKEGAMQELLTGRCRLPGFTERWERRVMSDYFVLINGRNSESNDNVVTISAQQGFVPQHEFFGKRVASKSLENYYLIESGDFAYNRSSASGYPFGAIKRFNGKGKAVVTTLYICFRIKPDVEADPCFFEQYFETGLLNNGLSQVANEGGRAHGLLNVTKADFFSRELRVPNECREQKAIAEILVAMDDEIAALEAKLAKARQIKEGMMQELLTGRIRLVCSQQRTTTA